jgi:hypothetical protein
MKLCMYLEMACLHNEPTLILIYSVLQHRHSLGAWTEHVGIYPYRKPTNATK